MINNTVPVDIQNFKEVLDGRFGNGNAIIVAVALFFFLGSYKSEELLFRNILIHLDVVSELLNIVHDIMEHHVLCEADPTFALGSDRFQLFIVNFILVPRKKDKQRTDEIVDVNRLILYSSFFVLHNFDGALVKLKVHKSSS